jgi:hypothetical protein
VRHGAVSSPRRLNTRHLARHARKAIRERLGPSTYPVDGVLAIERDGAAIIIRLNSGGNSLAVEPYLRGRGYHVEDAGTNPGGYGCALRVTAATPGRVSG